MRNIYIFGPSGGGTSTLGQALAEAIGARHLDTDDFYWQPTQPKFQLKRSVEDRLALLEPELAASDRVVLSGCVGSWGKPLYRHFTHAIYSFLPAPVRIARLRSREFGRYGSSVLPGGERHQEYCDFMAWCAKYETGHEDMRSRRMHVRVVRELACPVLVLEGAIELAERVRLARRFLD